MPQISIYPKVLLLRYRYQQKKIGFLLTYKNQFKVRTVPYPTVTRKLFFIRRENTDTDLSTLITMNTLLALWVGEHVILQPVLANQLFPAHLEKHPVISFKPMQ
jgi:hypothetical protein